MWEEGEHEARVMLFAVVARGRHHCRDRSRDIEVCLVRNGRGSGATAKATQQTTHAQHWRKRWRRERSRASHWHMVSADAMPDTGWGAKVDRLGLLLPVWKWVKGTSSLMRGGRPRWRWWPGRPQCMTINRKDISDEAGVVWRARAEIWSVAMRWGKWSTGYRKKSSNSFKSDQTRKETRKMSMVPRASLKVEAISPHVATACLPIYFICR